LDPESTGTYGAKNGTIYTMKKLISFLIVCLALTPMIASAQEESELFIRPYRETFTHFPTTTLANKYTLTVFLPEEFIPLKKAYPLVVLFGAGPRQADIANQFTQQHKAIVAALDFTEESYREQADKIVQFVGYELIPYVDTNYLTLRGPENRIIAGEGAAAADIILRLMTIPNLFGSAVLTTAGTQWQLPDLPSARFLIHGDQAELAYAQEQFEQKGKTYGPDFALRYNQPKDNLFNRVETDYLWAPAQKTVLEKVEVEFSDKVLRPEQPVQVRMWAQLSGDFVFHYVPAQLRIGPPYAAWNAENGTLSVVSGAESGKVKISGLVDKPAFSAKIKLKK